MAQTKPEKLTRNLQPSSVQKDATNVAKSGVAPPTASKKISKKFAKPIKAMKIKEIFDVYFKGKS